MSMTWPCFKGELVLPFFLCLPVCRSCCEGKKSQEELICVIDNKQIFSLLLLVTAKFTCYNPTARLCVEQKQCVSRGCVNKIR